MSDALPKGVLLVLLVVLVYLPSTQNFFIWDDAHHVGMAPEFYQHGLFAGLKSIWFNPLATAQYYPMVWSSYLIEHHFWGQNPLGYHIVNIVLHIVVSLLLWRVLAQLNTPYPFVVALLFALHPVNVESVAWISERKNVLSGLFYMASLLAFLKWQAQDRVRSKQDNSHVLYGISLLLFVCALTSKTVTATLPFVIMLLLWWKHALNRFMVLRLLPFVALGIVMGSWTVWMEQGHAGAIGEPWDLSFVERCLIAGRAVWFYLEKLLLPINLTFIYPRWDIDTSKLWQFVFPLTALAVVAIFYLLQSKIGRGPLAAVLIYGGTLFPALGFLNVFPMQFSFVADHFQYLASAAMLTLFIGVLHRLTTKFDDRLRVGFLTVVIAAYCINVWQLQAQYKNQTTLWLATLEKNPSAWIAHGNLGAIYMNEKRYDDAIESLQKAIELNPQHIIPYNNLAKLHLTLAQRQSSEDKMRAPIASALSYGVQAIRLGERERQFMKSQLIQPRVAQDHIDSHRIVGDIKRFQKDADGAILEYRAMLNLNPNSATAFSRLGAVELERKEYNKAQKYLNKALLLKPELFDAHYNLGIIYFRLNQLQRAENSLLESLRQGASEEFVLPHYYLGLIDEQHDRRNDAKEHFEIVALKLANQELGLKALNKMLDMALD